MRRLFLATQVSPAFFTILGIALAFTVTPEAINMTAGAGIVWVLLNVVWLVFWLLNRPSLPSAEESPARVTSPSPDYPKIRAMEQDLYGEWFTVDGLAERERLRPHRVRRSFEVACESDRWLR